MIKVVKFLFISLLGLYLLSGCNTDHINDDIFQYKDSFVGDNSAVGNIANRLAGAKQLTGMELKTNEQPYGITLNYAWEQSQKEYKETVVYNATFLFTLVRNVDWIVFHSDLGQYMITKENIQSWYDTELNEIETEDELRELIQKYLADESKVNQLLMSS